MDVYSPATDTWREEQEFVPWPRALRHALIKNCCGSPALDPTSIRSKIYATSCGSNESSVERGQSESNARLWEHREPSVWNTASGIAFMRPGCCALTGVLIICCATCQATEQLTDTESLPTPPLPSTSYCNSSAEQSCTPRWGFCGAHVLGNFTPCCSADDSCFVRSQFYSQCAPTAMPPTWSDGETLNCPATTAASPADTPPPSEPPDIDASNSAPSVGVGKDLPPDGPGFMVAKRCLEGCAEDWQACGGRGYSGWFSRCCSPDFVCARKNRFFSQCRPGDSALPSHWQAADVVACEVAFVEEAEEVPTAGASPPPGASLLAPLPVSFTPPASFVPVAPASVAPFTAPQSQAVAPHAPVSAAVEPQQVPVAAQAPGMVVPGLPMTGVHVHDLYAVAGPKPIDGVATDSVPNAQGDAVALS
eukprot:jgi/Ulvmu1/3610/UM017_0022.1